MPQGFVVWLTGLSGAGKTTIAQGVAARLRAAGLPVEVLDGDVVRQHLGQGLGFSRADRDTNIRRITFVAKLLARNGVAVVVAAISPYRAVRQEARAEIGRFVEVFVQCPLDELVRRDTKGLYARALRGELANFTGISDPYEEPLAPEVTLDTASQPVDECVASVLRAVARLGYVEPDVAAALAPDGAAQIVAQEADGRPAVTAGNGHVALRRNGPVDPVSGARDGIAVRTGHGTGDGMATRQTIAPHGGRLVNRIASAEEAAPWRDRAPQLPAITLTPRQVSDVEMIAIGGFSPLTGFLGARDYHEVLDSMHLASGLVWPIPITLAVSEDDGRRLAVGQPIALNDPSGRLLAIMYLEEKYAAEPEREAQSVYRTTDPAHPGVAVLYQQGPVLLAGPITLINRPASPFPAYRLDPAETRALFAARGWRRVVGFQTRNPVHRAHEYIQKAALEIVDGLLLHPLVGETKGDDIPAAVRMRCYEVLLEHYYPKDRVVLAINPAAMRYAGPREAVFHALVRQNYGCTHFIVGRDHAGVGNYYGPYDAQLIFDTFRPGEIGITPLFFDHTFYCRSCAGIVSAKTCPHDAGEHVTLSGTQVRTMLRAGEPLPPEFTRPEIAAVLLEQIPCQNERNEVVAVSAPVSA
jgi:sulfate adenylyltransferase/3'-phosphoadenosine 5'-phosphosulfate synthase